MDLGGGLDAALSWILIHSRGQDCLDAVGAEKRCI